jgi:hypothetical protein
MLMSSQSDTMVASRTIVLFIADDDMVMMMP